MWFLYLLALVVSASAADYDGNDEPFPPCAECLPASVHDAPGIGFSLSLSSGTSAIHFSNGTVRDIAVIPATPDYEALMFLLTNMDWPPPPLTKWQRWKRAINKKIGRPATPDVGVLGAMLVSLRDATVVNGPLDRVAVSHPRVNGLVEEDIWDALEYARLRPWVADLPRPKPFLPWPDAGAYPTQLTEAHAVLAAHGKGLCKHYKHYWECEEELSKAPLETTVVVGLTKTDLRAEVVRTTSAFTWLQPTKDERAFVSLTLGLDNRHTFSSEAKFWSHVVYKLRVFFTWELPDEARLSEVLLVGENSTHPVFLDALEEALVDSGYNLQDGSDAGARVRVVSGQGKPIDPVFASARGAAQYARWRQEAPVGCYEQERCEKKRREEDKRSEL
ncbi:hypothetical protein F53441_6462 [Fusarium austroafricanum]|uniref:Uncharacterized protein n=1 Tax=Fusarium austroafricanum TaxID=2364996 RepID=A0A8H4KJP2_9HYPO|nr:hypothetical protein F53441_6462 [Fusarium austroafricanum]